MLIIVETKNLMKSIFQGHQFYPGEIKLRSGLGFEPKLYKFNIHVTCRAVISAEPFDSVCIQSAFI